MTLTNRWPAGHIWRRDLLAPVYQSVSKSPYTRFSRMAFVLFINNQTVPKHGFCIVLKKVYLQKVNL